MLKIGNILPNQAMSFHPQCPVVKRVHEKEVTAHFTREDTFHRGHPLKDRGRLLKFISRSPFLNSS